MLSAAELQLLKSMMQQDKLDAASLNHLAVAFDKIATHNRLVQGKSTQNHAVHKYLNTHKANDDKS